LGLNFSPGTSWIDVNSCEVNFWPNGYNGSPINMVYLANDAVTDWSSGVIGSNTVLKNSQCWVYLASSSVNKSGQLMTVTFSIEFRDTLPGRVIVLKRSISDPCRRTIVLRIIQVGGSPSLRQRSA
jgi:hypothetical protein